MPTPLRSASIFLGDNAGALDPGIQAEATHLFQPTAHDVSLEGGSHVAKVIAAAVGKVQAGLASPAPIVSQTVARAVAVAEALPSALPDPNSPIVRSEPTLWSILRRVDLSTVDDRLLLRIGAIYLEAATSFGKPSPTALRAVLAYLDALGTSSALAALVVVEQTTNRAWTKVLGKMTPRTHSHRSAAADLAEQRIERRWKGERAFPNPQRQIGGGFELTATEVIHVAIQVRSSAERGNVLSYLIAIAHWIGLWLWELMQIQLFKPNVGGLVRVADDSTHVIVDLTGVFDDLARAGGPGCKPSTMLLRIPLPMWIAQWLRAYRMANPTAQSLADLTDLTLAKAMNRIPELDAAHQDRATVRRFIDSRVAPVFEDRHQHVIAIGLLAFRLAEKSAYNYPAVTFSEIRDVLELRATKLNWGQICEVAVDDDECVGSRKTPLRSAVIELLSARRKAVEASRPGPNAGWDRLVEFHNHFIRYILVLCTLAWLLRGNAEHHLPNSLMQLFKALGFRDKEVPHATCAPAPLTCGSILRLQLDYLRVHLPVLIKRLAKRTEGRTEREALVMAIQASGQGVGPDALLWLVEDNSIRVAGARDLGAGLPLDWNFSADALRHFATDAHREVGSSAAMIELMLRHAGNGFELFSSACAVSMREWEADAGAAQDRMLGSLQARAVAGLVITLQGASQ